MSIRIVGKKHMIYGCFSVLWVSAASRTSLNVLRAHLGPSQSRLLLPLVEVFIYPSIFLNQLNTAASTPTPEIFKIEPSTSEQPSWFPKPTKKFNSHRQHAKVPRKPLFWGELLFIRANNHLEMPIFTRVSVCLHYCRNAVLQYPHIDPLHRACCRCSSTRVLF